MSYTGSITENRVQVGLPPPVRQWLADEARGLGMTMPAIMRHKIMKLWEEHQEPKK